MSQRRHDFSDPAKRTSDARYWHMLHRDDPFRAERERAVLILTRFNTETAALISKTPFEQRRIIATSRTTLMKSLIADLVNNPGLFIPETANPAVLATHTEELYRAMGEVFRVRPTGDAI